MIKGTGSIYSVDTLDKGMIHVQGFMEQGGVRFHHATQNSESFKVYELFTSGTFFVIFSDLH